MHWSTSVGVQLHQHPTVPGSDRAPLGYGELKKEAKELVFVLAATVAEDVVISEAISIHPFIRRLSLFRRAH